jgi:hypothetical protein
MPILLTNASSLCQFQKRKPGHARPALGPAFTAVADAYLNDIPIRDAYVPVEFGGNVWAIGGCYTIRF